MSNLFAIGLSGLNAAQQAISTTSNNISNTTTPGYSREIAMFAEGNETFTGSGYIGGGVTTVTIQRQFSNTLTTELNSVQSQSSSINTYSQLVTGLSNEIGDPTGGVGAAFSTFFADLQTLSGAASSGPDRQTVMSDAQSIATQLNELGQQIDQMQQGVNTTLTGTVPQINNLTKQIAQLNTQIAAAGTSGQPPNQLLDARDAAVAQLSQLVGVNVTQAADGSYSVSLSNGMALVQGNQSFQLGTTPSPSNPSQLAITYQQPDSTKPGSFVTTVLPDSAVTGGTLGGTLQFRDQTLIPAAQQLGALATSFAAQVNAQNELGQDETGNPGAALFKVPAPNVIANLNNTGSATVSATLTNPASPPSDDMKLTFDGTNYTLTDTTTGQVLGQSPASAGNPITIGGVSLTINGTMAAGDSYTIQPTEGALDGFGLVTPGGDGSTIAAASPAVASAASANQGSAKIAIGAASQGFLISSPFTLTYNATAGTLTGFPVGSTVTFGNPPQPITITSANTPVPYDPTNGDTYTITNPGPPVASPNGISFTLTGTPKDQDTFTIGPNTGGVDDGSNANAISQLSASTAFQGTTLTTGYADFVNNVGSAASGATSLALSTGSTLSQIQQQQQSVSGVNLDEEATNLVEYQQLYQAASKVITTAQSLFTTLLQAVN
ncbi:flagellar hook-associated protein FlgK [Paraburkholderia solisilvae]|uniref:Flagellar hook-associated protein 1 n=1 Tax=Paraburkholderia solisilvae TaxID=624376 RepID=A0A6J5F2K2_9BURK|nr:flagellar hook-associated protein FlgK [Paraburkholderia solisilvae]CAB3771802.1 hypothetical protein LMG29739_06124 [Paraburkholderia solisilvae]